MSNPDATLACEQCSRPFTVPHKRRLTARFCSPKCAGSAGGQKSSQAARATAPAPAPAQPKPVVSIKPPTITDEAIERALVDAPSVGDAMLKLGLADARPIRAQIDRSTKLHRLYEAAKTRGLNASRTKRRWRAGV